MSNENLTYQKVIKGDLSSPRTMIVFHGLGASMYDLAGLEMMCPAMAQFKLIFVQAPTIPITLNAGMVMPGWFDIRSPDIISNEDEQGILQAVRGVENLIDEITPECKSVTLLGFSQGGALSLISSLLLERQLSAVIGLSCWLPLLSACDKWVDTNKNTPVFLAGGTLDMLVPLQLTQSAQSVLSEYSRTATFKSYPMVHQICDPQLADLDQWLRANVLDV